MITWSVKDNILGDVGLQVRSAAQATLTDAGELFKRAAIMECPKSKIRTRGYVHLWQTIGYEVDTDSTVHQSWVTFYVDKPYAHYVNDGTSRMAPRPFFTDGVIAVADKYEHLIRVRCHDLIMGRAQINLHTRGNAP